MGGRINRISINGNKNISVQDVKDATLTFNMGISAEVEKVIKDIDNWLGQHHGVIRLMVITTTKDKINQFDAHIRKIIPLDQYGDEPRDWKPFAEGNSIFELLLQYYQKANMEMEVWFCSEWDISTDVEWKIRLKDIISKEMILVVDGIALNDATNQKFVKIFDRSEIGGCLAPIGEHLTSDIQQQLRNNIRENLNDLSDGILHLYEKEYTNIELEVRNKHDFFRRLTNIAQKCLGVKRKGQIQYGKPYNDVHRFDLHPSL